MKENSIFKIKDSTFTLGLVTLEAVLISVLEGFVIKNHLGLVQNCLATPIKEGVSESDLIYHSLFIIAQVFQVILCVDALRQRNTAQLCALISFGLLLVDLFYIKSWQKKNSYAGIQLKQHVILENAVCGDARFWKPVESRWSNDTLGMETAMYFYESVMRPIEYTIIGLIPVFFLILVFFGWRLRKQFAWDNYKNFSADMKIRDALIVSSMLLTLLKLDFFFIFSFAAQLIPSVNLGYSNTTTETILVFVLGGIFLTLAIISVYKESKYGLGVSILAGIGSIGYFIYRLYIITMPTGNNYDPYLHTRQFLIFTTVVAMILLLITIIVAFKCFWNIYRGTSVFKNTSLGKNKPKIENNQIIDQESIDGEEEVRKEQTSLLNEKKKIDPIDSNNLWTIE